MRDPYGKKTPFVAVDANAKDQKADISNPETWTTFENALAFYKQRKTFDAVSYYQTLSLGYAMTAEDNLIFSDLDLRLDGLNDAEKKVAVQRFRAVVNVCSQLESYGEISVSGEGQHYLIRGKLDDAYAEGRAKEMPIELYSKDRFVIMTGHRLNDFDISDNDRSVGLINNIQKHYFELKGQAVSDWSQKPIISVLNKLGEKLRQRGASVYFMTVNPVDEGLEASYGYTVKNTVVVDFICKLAKSLTGYGIIDTYDYLVDHGFKATDGIHYAADTYKVIYQVLCEAIRK